MASPPSAGNPINVGPYKRIVGFHWPDTTPPVPVKYIWTWGRVRPSALDLWGFTEPWDGVAGGYPGYPYQSYSIKTMEWIEPFSSASYFTNAYVFDADGSYIDGGPASALGMTINKPSLPNLVTFAPWEISMVTSVPFATPMTVPVPNPVSTFYADAGIAKAICYGFNADPPPTFYQSYLDGIWYMDKFAIPNVLENFPSADFDMRGVTATYAGLTFEPIGFYHAVSGADSYYQITVLLKSTGYAP